MFSLFQGKPKAKETSLTTDSDDSESNFYESEPTCIIQSNATIISNVSGSSAKIKFERGSFVFSRTDNNSLELQFHPIFLWRVILFYESKKNDEAIIDFIRLRSFVSKFMRKRGFDVCFVVSDCDIQYILDDAIVVKSVSRDVHANLILIFHKLHLSLSRQYDSYELSESMLDETIRVLRIVSGI